MAIYAELQLAETDQTVTVELLNASGQVWNGSAYVDRSTMTLAQWQAVLIAATESEFSDTGAGLYRTADVSTVDPETAVFYRGAAPTVADKIATQQLGGSTLTADERAAVASATRTELTTELGLITTNLDAKVSEAGVSEGEGAYTGTLTVDDGETGLEGAVVNAYRGGVLIAAGITDASGQIADWVFDAHTYDLAVRLPGYQPKTDTVTVSGDAWTKTISLTAISFTAPASANLCTVQFRVALSGTAVAGAVCNAKLLGINQASDGTILSSAEMSDTTDAQGVAELQLVRGSDIIKGNGLYRIWVTIAGKTIASVDTRIPSQSTILFEDLLT